MKIMERNVKVWEKEEEIKQFEVAQEGKLW